MRKYSYRDREIDGQSKYIGRDSTVLTLKKKGLSFLGATGGARVRAGQRRARKDSTCIVQQCGKVVIIVTNGRSHNSCS